MKQFVNLSETKDFAFLREDLNDDELQIIENIIEIYYLGEIELVIPRDENDNAIIEDIYVITTDETIQFNELARIVLKWYESFEDTDCLIYSIKDYVLETDSKVS